MSKKGSIRRQNKISNFLSLDKAGIPYERRWEVNCRAGSLEKDRIACGIKAMTFDQQLL
jgi:hypothetical protein